jgi:hypothetical protein
MNRQMRVYEILTQLERGDRLNVGDRNWIVDLLKSAISGTDIRPALGFGKQKGAAPEKPFFVSLLYRCQRQRKVSAAAALTECSRVFGIRESTAADYIKLHSKQCKDLIKGWGLAQAEGVARLKSK